LTWYEFLLFFHISMAVIWVGGGAAVQVFALRALKATDPMRMADFAGEAEYIGTRVFIPASLLAFVSGVWMVIDSDFLGFGDDWIVIGLILYAVTFLAGALFLGPEAGRIKQQAETDGPTSPAVQARIVRILALSRADLMLLFLLVYDMAVKPSWGDLSLWVAIAGFAILAGILVRNGLGARVGAASAEPMREPAA
jgi:uncharacterized membrane protein